MAALGYNQKNRAENRAWIHYGKDYAEEDRHQDDQDLGRVERHRRETADHTLNHLAQPGTNRFGLFHSFRRSRLRGLPRGFGLAILRCGLGNFSADFRLEFFLVKHSLLFHFDQGLLEAFPVSGQPVRELDDRILHRHEESPACQGNGHNQCRHDKPRHALSSTF
jgi:hypothetical protein